jgi:hypothetical protein
MATILDRQYSGEKCKRVISNEPRQKKIFSQLIRLDSNDLRMGSVFFRPWWIVRFRMTLDQFQISKQNEQRGEGEEKFQLRMFGRGNGWVKMNKHVKDRIAHFRRLCVLCLLLFLR